MRFRFAYSHVPLAAVSVLLLLAVIGWLVVHRDGLVAPSLRLAGSEPGVVTVDPESRSPSTGPEPPVPRPAPPGAAAPESPAAHPLPRMTPRPEHFTLETGPYLSPEAADPVEDQLNRLGYATARFRKQDVTRLYVVAATGFGSADEARQATGQIGRGTVIEGGEAAEVVVDRLPSLGDAVAAARPLREMGFTVRVRETQSPIVIYHIRCGQFARLADAQALRESVARHGIHGRVIKVR